MKQRLHFFLILSVLLSVLFSCVSKQEAQFYVENSYQLSDNSALKNKATDGLDL